MGGVNNLSNGTTNSILFVGSTGFPDGNQLNCMKQWSEE